MFPIHCVTRYTKKLLFTAFEQGFVNYFVSRETNPLSRGEFCHSKREESVKITKKNVDTKRVVLFYTKWTVDKTRFKILKNWLSFAWGCVDFTLSIMSRVKITQPYIKLSNVNIFYRTGHSGPEWNRFVQKTKKYKFVQIGKN